MVEKNKIGHNNTDSTLNRNPTGIFISETEFWIGNSESGIKSYSVSADGSSSITYLATLTNEPTESIIIQRQLT